MPASMSTNSTTEVATQKMSEFQYRIEAYSSGKEVKWSLFATGKRASIGKIIVQLIPCCEEHFDLHNSQVERASSFDSECKDGSSHRSESETDIFMTDCNVNMNTETVSCHRAPYIFVENVFIDKRFRGRNLSSYMLQYCKSYFIGLNKSRWYYRYIELEAEEDMDHYGKLVDLYLRNGYQVLYGSDSKEFKVLYNGEQTFRVVPMRNFLFKPEPLIFPLTNGVSSKLDNREELGDMKELHTFDFVQSMKEETVKRSRLKMTISDALIYLNELFPGSLRRATAISQEIEAAGHPEWLQFVGLIMGVGLLQNQLLWCAPFSQSDKKSIGQLLPLWAHADDCSSWAVKDTAALRQDAMPWSCYEYLFTLLTRGKNRRIHSIPLEGLETLRYFNVDISDNTGGNILEEALGVQFWVGILRKCQKSAESKLKTESISQSKFEDKHARLLDTFCPEVIAW
mmetsp:Transcript_5121/g.6690  ORF Transcript_5121/g.6690 Transcript_5121/m.6690 type:complete len:455 (+) Transcript_5121:376-1740(+)